MRLSAMLPPAMNGVKKTVFAMPLLAAALMLPAVLPAFDVFAQGRSTRRTKPTVDLTAVPQKETVSPQLLSRFLAAYPEGFEKDGLSVGVTPTQIQIQDDRHQLSDEPYKINVWKVKSLRGELAYNNDDGYRASVKDVDAVLTEILKIPTRVSPKLIDTFLSQARKISPQKQKGYIYADQNYLIRIVLNKLNKPDYMEINEIDCSCKGEPEIIHSNAISLNRRSKGSIVPSGCMSPDATPQEMMDVLKKILKISP